MGLAATEHMVSQHQIYEELPPDTFIANIVLDAKLDIKYSPNELRLLHFRLDDRRGATQNYRQYFIMEERTGILRTAKRIDRESMCAHRITCSIHLNVMVQPGQYFQIIKVSVEILDINDNAPVFPQNLVNRKISETTMPGAVFALPSAEDDDSSSFAIQRYELVSETKMFELQVTNTTRGNVDLHLILRGKLDREDVENYLMEVVAMDGGNPPKSGAMMIQITVLDANDNNPKFNNYTYEVTISENTPIGSTILQLHADDPDKGPNGKIEYKFATATQAQNGGLFGIDNETGEIFIKGPIDFERGNIYYLTVTARDHGQNSLPAYAKVVVKVQDVNDHAPHITINALTTTGYVEVSESAEVGTFVAHVSVADFDSGVSGEFSCRMASDQFRLQKLYATEFKIITTTTFDREIHSEYHLNMVCTDKGNPPKTATEHIIVTILDANDHSPEFQHRVYTAELRENNEVGAFITQVVALDRDSGKNAQVKYSIVDDDRRLLSVNEKTGIIRAIVKFDYEQDHELHFVVEAKDQGSPQNAARAMLRLIILDINDEKPEFSQAAYTFHVLENMREKTFVGTVIATDRDTPSFNQITYSLHPDYDGLRSFSINPYTGEITTKRELDREEQSRYLLVVVASNDGYPMMRSLGNVTVFVDDQNDNAPILDYPNDWNNTVHIARTMKIGGRIAHIRAHDLDANLNSELTYSIFDGNGGEFFRMNATSGVIYLNKVLETEGYQYHKMKVVVRDHGKPEKEAMGDFNIVVNKSLAVLQYQNSGFSFLKIKDSHVIIGAIITIFVILLAVLVVVIVKCRRKRNPRHQKYNCRREAKKRDGKKKDRRESMEWKAVPNDWSDKDNKPKKAVTFRMEVEEGEGEEASQQLWPPNVDNDCNQVSDDLHLFLDLFSQMTFKSEVIRCCNVSIVMYFSCDIFQPCPS